MPPKPSLNLLQLIDRGVRIAGGSESDRAAEAARRTWTNKLLAHEIRAWSNISDADRDVLTTLSALLALAGMAHAYDSRDIDSPEIRVIRGAISAAEQCGRSGSVIAAEHARAFSAACHHAREILQRSSRAAIQHAAAYLARTTA